MNLPILSNKVFKLLPRSLSLLGVQNVQGCDCTLMDLGHRNISTSCPMEAKSAGRFKVTRKHNNPLTYEQSFKPNHIGVTKSWNSMNNTGFPQYGLKAHSVLTEDVFIRRFMVSTWHRLVVSEVLIKRNANMIRVGCIVVRHVPPRKVYFLAGYTEELLSYWLQCPVKLELQTVNDVKAVIHKYV